MTSSRKAERVVRRKLADGTTAEYRYPAWSAKAKVDRFGPDSVAALIRAYQRSPEWLALAAATRAHHGTYLRDLELIGTERATLVTRRVLLEMRDSIASGRGNGAATGFIRACGSLFAWAVDREWLEHSPVHKIKPLPSSHLPAWTPAEAALALRNLPEHLRRVVVLGMHTGQRRSDLIALPWSAYDGAAIRLRQVKMSRPGKPAPEMLIPASAELRAELDAWRRKATSTLVLTDRNGLPWRGEYLSAAMKHALAGIEGIRPGLNVHGLRKLAAANLANGGCSVHEIQAITGHKTLSMLALYTASVDQQRLATAAVIRLDISQRTTIVARSYKNGKKLMKAVR